MLFLLLAASLIIPSFAVIVTIRDILKDRRRARFEEI
jgi:hypothetical protein